MFTFALTTRVCIFNHDHYFHPLKCPTEPQSDNIKELAYDEGKGWYQGALNVPSAYAGTKLAAVTYFFQGQTQIRVYYQEKSLALKEFGWDGTKWFQGQPLDPDITLPI